MKKDIHFREVAFPHLRATVKFFDQSKLRGVPIKGSGYTTLMSKDELWNIEIGVFFEDIESNVKRLESMPFIAHEVIHALQYICEERGIDMELEKESVAYMGTYLLQSLIEV